MCYRTHTHAHGVFNACSTANLANEAKVKADQAEQYVMYNREEEENEIQLESECQILV